jgi:16S rRNA (uracil1498-N3)-methyltransferase
VTTAPAWAATAGARALVHVDDALAADRHVVEGEDGHHLGRVRRLRAGEPVVVADGAGRWRSAEVVAVAGATVTLEAHGPERVEPVLRPGLTVGFALARADRGVEVVRQLVELGVDRVVPLRAERSVVRWDDGRAADVHGRLARVAREAAMQCHRATIPEVGPPVGVERWHRDGPVFVGAPAGDDFVAVAPNADVDAITLVTGPEGGFTPSELDVLAGCSVAVGPHVLRAVTAPVALTAVAVAWRASRARSGDAA